jgi:putative ABC transport system permease protein
MARRNLRAGSRHYLPIVAAIALGVGAVVAVGSAADHARRAIAREAKSLMAADIEIRSTRPLSVSSEAAVARLTSQGAQATTVVELAAMAATTDQTVLVELKAVEDAYPFYGTIETEPAGRLADFLATGPVFGAVVQDALLIRLGLSLGDRFRLGDAEFVASAALRAAPDQPVGVFNLGPRVLVSRDALAATALVRPGSRVRYRTLIALPADAPSVEAVRDALRTELANEPVRVAAFTDGQPQLRRSLDRLGVYLGLVGVTAMLLGGVGVAGSARALLAERWRTLALLKCLGADSRTVAGITLIELAALGLLGGVLGAGLGAAGQHALTAAARAFTSVSLEASWNLWPYAQGVAVGMLAGAAFSLWPLASAAAAPAAAALRHEAVPLRPRPRTAWLLVGFTVAGAIAFAWWQVGSPSLAALYVCGLAAAGAVLVLSGRVVSRLAKTAAPPASFAWRRGLRALARPGAHTTAAVLSLGLGVTAVLIVGLVERAVRAELTEQIPRTAPSLFFIDIQPDQRDPFAALVAERGVPLDLVPVARSRLATIDGRVIGSEGPAGTDPEYRWYFTREYVVTAAAKLPRGNQVVQGRWWDEIPEHERSGALVSVEEEAAQRMGLAVGSTVSFDLYGIPLAARVASLRSVDWDTHGLNFFMIFSPAALDGAPLTYLGAAQAPPAEDLALQRAVVQAFPNVTAIPLGDVLAAVARVVRRAAAAARGVAVLVAVVGFVVLGGALAASREARLREAMLLKTFGATRGAVVRALAVEFGLLGAAAGLIAGVLSSAAAWAITRWLLDLPWAWAPGPVFLAAAATVVGTIGFGLASSYRLLGKRPFPVLRGE